MLKSKSLSVLVGTVALGAVWALTAQPAKAGLWTASGSGSDGPLDAEANITFSTGEMHVTLTNLLSGATIGSAGQSVSDLSITLSSSPGTNVEANNTAAGQLVDVAKSNNAVTDVPGTPGRWVGLEPPNGSFGISGDTITLEAIGGSQPKELILPADIGGFYPAADGSINNTHQPYTDGPATFTVDLSSVTSSTTISSVQFSFGTGPDKFLPGVPVVPAPPIGHGLPVLLAVGGLLFGAKLLERRNQRRSLGTATPHAA